MIISFCQVIVKDIVSKNVVTQLRAHRSPISALRFDPSGTILVTASVQGHSINVYKIMPCHSEAPDTGPSNVHLYKLQRGYTNAVSASSCFSNYGQCRIFSFFNVFVHQPGLF